MISTTTCTASVRRSASPTRRARSYPDGTPRGGHLTRYYTPSDRPGGRFPHLWLDMARKHSTLDWFDKDFTVVAGPLGEEWLEAGRDVSTKTRLAAQPAAIAQRPSRRRHPDGNARRGAGASRRPRRLAHAVHPLGSRARTGRRAADTCCTEPWIAIEANGTSIAFKRSGKGPPSLLLHGAEADHSMFDAFGALLAPHFTVIAYDQRDSGETRNPPSPYGFDELADDAAR